MSNFTLKIEVIAGSSIEECLKQGIELAQKFGIIIEFKFNSVKIFLIPSYTFDDIDELIKKYENKLKHKSSKVKT